LFHEGGQTDGWTDGQALEFLHQKGNVHRYATCNFLYASHWNYFHQIGIMFTHNTDDGV
jgi:hypothetical protein